MGQSASLRVLPQHDVVILRAREVLEHVAEALLWHDAEIEAKGVVRDDRRLRVAARDDFRDPVAAAERLDEGRRVARCRDEIEIADRLTAAPNASGLRHGDRRGMLLQLGDDTSHRRQRRREEPPLLGLVADAGLERRQDLLLAPRAHPRQVAQSAGFRGGLQAVERGDAELRPDPRGGLRLDSGGSRRKSTTPAGTSPRRSSARASLRLRRPPRPCSRSSSRSPEAPSPSRRARARRSAAATP